MTAFVLHLRVIQSVIDKFTHRSCWNRCHRCVSVQPFVSHFLSWLDQVSDEYKCMNWLNGDGQVPSIHHCTTEHANGSSRRKHITEIVLNEHLRCYLSGGYSQSQKYVEDNRASKNEPSFQICANTERSGVKRPKDNAERSSVEEYHTPVVGESRGILIRSFNLVCVVICV